MKYVDAGYIICMGSLFIAAVALVLRRRRLERAVEVSQRDQASPGSSSGHDPVTAGTSTATATGINAPNGAASHTDTGPAPARTASARTSQ